MSKPATSIFSRAMFVTETTFNTLPATPTMTIIPFVDCSLALDISKVVDSTIQSDALHRSVVPTTQKVAGTISGEVSHTNMDWIFSGMMYGSWTANVLTNGTVQNTYSIEVGSLDIGQYFLYTGSVVDKLALTFAAGGLVTYKADFVGSSQTLTTSTNATTVANAAQTAPMATVSATIKEGGSVVATIMGGTFSFDRKHTVNYVLGNAQPVSMSTGFFDVSGTLDVYLEDQVIYNKFINNSNTSLDWTITDGSNSYELIIPNMFYTSISKDVKGTGPVTLKANFTAVKDFTTNTNIKIVRSS